MTSANEKDISRRLIDAIVGGYCARRKKAIQSPYGVSVRFGPVPAAAPEKRRNFEDIIKERLRCMIFWRGISTVKMSLHMRHGKQWVGNRVLFDRVTCGLDDAVQICEALGENSFVLFRPYLGGGVGEGALRFIEENPGNVTSHTMRKFYGQTWRKVAAILVHQGLVVRNEEGCYQTTPDGKMALVLLDIERIRGFNAELLSRP